MCDFKPYYTPIELDNGMVRGYGHPHVTDIKHLDTTCGTIATAAHYFISRYLDQPIDGELVLSEIIKLQDTDPNSHTFGNFRWYREEYRIQDTNAAFFTMKQLCLALLMCPEKIPQKEKDMLAPALEKVTEWFRKECKEYGYYYPNKIVSDGAMLMLIATSRKEPELLKEAYDFWNKWLDYTDEYGWGWGENTSKVYSNVINDAFEIALISMNPTSTTYARVLEKRQQLLDYMSYHDDYEVTPSIRTYNFFGEAKPGGGIESLTGSKASGKEQDLKLILNKEGKLAAGTISALLLHAAAPVYVPNPDKASFHSERIFGKSYAQTYKGNNIRLGTITRYPVMCGCDQGVDPIIGGWGLGWQSMPVSAVAMNHETSFLRYAAVADGQLYSHISSGWTAKTLFPDENIIDSYTFSQQKDNCAVIARMVEHIANKASYFADEWYFQHFDGEVKNIGDWFVFDYGDCALALKNLTGKLEMIREGENIRLVNKLYDGEDKLLVCRRFISCWAAVALDSTEDIEGQLAKIPTSAEKLLDLRYSRENPRMLLTCGSATMDFDPDKTNLI